MTSGFKESFWASLGRTLSVRVTRSFLFTCYQVGTHSFPSSITEISPFIHSKIEFDPSNLLPSMKAGHMTMYACQIGTTPLARIVSLGLCWNKRERFEAGNLSASIYPLFTSWCDYTLPFGSMAVVLLSARCWWPAWIIFFHAGLLMSNIVGNGEVKHWVLLGGGYSFCPLLSQLTHLRLFPGFMQNRRAPWPDVTFYLTNSLVKSLTIIFKYCVAFAEIFTKKFKPWHSTLKTDFLYKYSYSEQQYGWG